LHSTHAPPATASASAALHSSIMTKINASNLPSSDIVAPACVKYHKPLSKKKKKKKTIEMDAIGTPTYNLLLELMKCQVKHPNLVATDSSVSADNTAGSGAKKCVKIEKAYSACHAAVMGVGNYNGRKHCGEEMEQLFLCVNPDAVLPWEDIQQRAGWYVDERQKVIPKHTIDMDKSTEWQHFATVFIRCDSADLDKALSPKTIIMMSSLLPDIYQFKEGWDFKNIYCMPFLGQLLTL